jgi:hypothetical protein
MSKAFSAQRLRQSPSFVRLTGVSADTFQTMLQDLATPWDAMLRARRKSGRPTDVGGLEDHLLIMLIYYRCYVTQEFLGFFYHVDKSAICRAIKRIETIVTPIYAVRREPVLTREEAEAVLIDCTEQPIQRPQDPERQREHYSGKKKRHTAKIEYIVTAKGRIAAVSDTHPGSRHDLSVRRAGPALPDNAHIYADSAYQGYDKEHRRIDYPYRKPKGGELAEDDKEYNRALARKRVGVEHRIGRSKRYRIISERFRNPLRTHHTKVSIVAGLVNLEDGFPPV